MSYAIVIPARYDSKRLPGKALKNIKGKPMIQRVHEAALNSQASEIIVATDSEKIKEDRSQKIVVVFFKLTYPTPSCLFANLLTIAMFQLLKLIFAKSLNIFSASSSRPADLRANPLK